MRGNVKLYAKDLRSKVKLSFYRMFSKVKYLHGMSDASLCQGRMG